MLLGSLLVFTPGGLGLQDGLALPKAESLVALAFFIGGLSALAPWQPCDLQLHGGKVALPPWQSCDLVALGP